MSVPHTEDETLYCKMGHYWLRPKTRGRKPAACPEHKGLKSPPTPGRAVVPDGRHDWQLRVDPDELVDPLGAKEEEAKPLGTIEIQRLFTPAENCSRCGMLYTEDRPADRALPGICVECKTDEDEKRVVLWAQNTGAALLAEVKQFIERYVTLRTEAEYDMLAVWALHTFVFREKRFTPYVLALSPMKGSGKSTLLDVMFFVCCRAFTVIDPAAAATAEHIDATAPTWLVDEIDGVWSTGGKDKAQLRTIINSGFQRGRKWTRKRKGGIISYDIYCPKFLAGIEDYSVPATTRDRCIQIVLRKQTKEEAAKRNRITEETEVKGAYLNAWAFWWSETNKAVYKHTYPKMPGHLNGRGWDKWETLFAVAEIAGGRWPEAITKASLELIPEEDEDPKAILLADLRTVFGSDQWLESQVICSRLNSLEDSIWADYRGKGLTTTMLARMLRSFAIKPSPERHGGKQRRGYDRKSFEEEWTRWLG
ncbi:MAG: DUF3631 domain-containing protein [Isosphaeraceae bacterium]